TSPPCPTTSRLRSPCPSPTGPGPRGVGPPRSGRDPDLLRAVGPRYDGTIPISASMTSRRIWPGPGALPRGDPDGAIAALDLGPASPEHAAFVGRLAAARRVE